LFLQNWHSSVYPTAPAGLIFTGDTAQNPYGKALTAAHWNVLSPRIGLVWDPKGDGRQTIRASFSLLHDTTELFYPERWTTNAPYVSSLTLTTGQFSDPFANYSLGNGRFGDPFPGNVVFPVGGAYISVPPNNDVTYVMQWNLSYQRQIANDWVLKVNYLGNAGRHIWGSTDVNYGIPLPGSNAAGTNNRRLTYLANPTTGQFYGNIQQTDDGANSEYHGLHVSAEHRFAKHYSLLSNFGWSHCISSWDFAGELAGTVYQNPTNRKTGERGNCGYDHRLVFNTSLVATSPGFGSGAARLLTKDWQVTPAINTFTGNPIQLTAGKDISQSLQGLDRPNVVAPDQVHAPPASDPMYWFNPAAFQCAGSNAACTLFSGQFGNLGRNSVYGPGQINIDMALTRRFPVKERWKLDLRADFFNILNHANLGNPITSLSSGTFGQITGYYQGLNAAGGNTPRVIQMAVKLYF
ncbi:MAG TPA: carboxypeptidase regulatory-like domain-containing protein, partial [Bryobacteraceae bacterium]